MDANTRKTLFSSATDEWATPQDFFDALNAEFGFTLDPCATHENAKCARYFTVEDDGLAQDWSGHTVFMNPPYSEPEQPCKPKCKKKRCSERGFHIDEYVPGQIDWVRKAHDEWRKGGTTVVCLIPARTDTELFHCYINPYYERLKCGESVNFDLRFVKGRLKFGNAENTAPFPSMVVIYRGL